MKAYKKEIIIENKTVAGNIKDYKQSYRIVYYPKAEELPDKIALYINLINSEGKEYAKRSLYFSSCEQLRELIFDLTQAHFRLLGERIIPDIPLAEFRKIRLDDFLYKLRTHQLNIWKEVYTFDDKDYLVRKCSQ